MPKDRIRISYRTGIEGDEIQVVKKGGLTITELDPAYQRKIDTECLEARQAKAARPFCRRLAKLVLNF